ncbi:MAG: hypothetical protein Q6361_04755 [Candidatus Hermodarchaeota archaeon]|jgi:hypothetical protein|nr:hypothetical protein [Candidatus Hermodarchaeota archaeon]
MSTPIISQQTATVPDLPDHAFRLVKVIETRKDVNNQEVHYLTVLMETLIDGLPSRQKVTSLALSTNQDDLPTLSWQGYVEQDL